MAKIKLATIWLFTGFAMGTTLLLGPLRLLLNAIRTNHISGTVENAIVTAVIILLVLASGWVSFKIFRWQSKFAIAIPAMAAVIALWLMMNPAWVNHNAADESIAPQFTIGPYPTPEKVRELKAQGYTGIVSLLHPAVVPFEPRLLKEEREAASTNHMQLIQAPMLPWISDNEHSIQIIKDLIKNGRGKYYVHCYLGKDRVNLVKKIIMQQAGRAQSEHLAVQRSFEQQGVFERGAIYKVDSQVYMTPFPTDEELLAFFLAGNIKTVINFMDTTAQDAKPWIVKERNALSTVNIAFFVMPVKEEAAIAAVIRAIDSLPKPLVVHHWNTVCPESEQFRKMYFAKANFTPINLAIRK